MFLPTGGGKSLCHTALPYTFDILGALADSFSIVVVSRGVVCPLHSVMDDHVSTPQGG